MKYYLIDPTSKKKHYIRSFFGMLTTRHDFYVMYGPYIHVYDENSRARFTPNDILARPVRPWFKMILCLLCLVFIIKRSKETSQEETVITLIMLGIVVFLETNKYIAQYRQAKKFNSQKIELP